MAEEGVQSGRSPRVFGARITSLDAILTVLATILAPPLAALLMLHLKRRKDKTRWRSLRTKDFPIWLVHKTYRRRYPSKSTIGEREFTLRGSYYEYKVVFRGPTVPEPSAKVRHMKVSRRRKKG